MEGRFKALKLCFDVMTEPFLPPHCPFTTKMQLDTDKYDVVVLGTGLAESIAAA